MASSAGRFFGSGSNKAPPAPPIPSTGENVASEASGAPAPVVTQAFPAWSLGIPLEMHVYLTTSPYIDAFARGDEGSLPHFVWDNITFGDWAESRTVEFDVKIPTVSSARYSVPAAVRKLLLFQSVQHNGSMFIDVFLVKDGASPNPSNAKFDTRSVHHSRHCELLIDRLYQWRA